MSTTLVTGGTGCIGAVTVRDLLTRGCERIVIATRRSDPERLGHWLDDPGDPRIEWHSVDLADGHAVAQLVARVQPSCVVHLAALQSPDCDRDPELGMRINVGATQALLEASERLSKPLKRFVFASSAAVYGPRSLYPQDRIAEDAALVPPNRYGVWKVAGEQLCCLFYGRTGVDTVSLRLNTTYGPGRDQGLTSAVTTAMKRVARGEPFRMPYRGRENYHYVEDVGAHFALAATEPFDGCAAFNIRGQTVEVEEFLATIARVARELGMGDGCDLGMADDVSANLFVSDLDDCAVEARFPAAPRTPLEEGVRRSLRAFAATA